VWCVIGSAICTRTQFKLNSDAAMAEWRQLLSA
jgi:hypothetical protein